VAIAANVGVTSTPRMVPYLSVDMMKNHRRRGVQLDNLVPRGRADEQDAALAELIESASVWIDDTVLMPIGGLAATYDTMLSEVSPDRYGSVRLHPRCQPVIALADFWSGPAANMLTQATDLSVAAVQPDRITMPIGGALSWMSDQGPLQFGAGSLPDERLWVKYTYINGFPVTQLTQAVAKGDLAIHVDDCTGIIAGQTWLTVYALQNRMRFLAGTVSATSGPGTVACPAAPYAIPTTGYSPPMVSALPQSVIEAAVLVVRAMVKEAGGGSSKPAGKHSGSSEEEATAGDDYAEAEAFLHTYILPIE
jgi:hypothetical protein